MVVVVVEVEGRGIDGVGLETGRGLEQAGFQGSACRGMGLTLEVDRLLLTVGGGRLDTREMSMGSTVVGSGKRDGRATQETVRLLLQVRLFGCSVQGSSGFVVPSHHHHPPLPPSKQRPIRHPA